MKCKDVMRQILSDTMPSWMKYPDQQNARKVYSIGDLRYLTEHDSTLPSMEKMRQHLPFASNLTLNNQSMLTSTLSKLLARKRPHRSTADLSYSTQHLKASSSPVTSMKKSSIAQEKIQLFECIGQGRFGMIFRALYRIKQNDSLTVAVKKLHSEFRLSHDIDVLQGLRHPHIVECFGLLTSTDATVMIVTEYAHSQSLDHCIRSKTARRDYSIGILLEFLKQTISAMCYLEKQCFVHRYLTCRNILVFNPTLVKISDLDLCRSTQSDLSSLRSSAAWMSPEVMDRQQFSTASDVYAFGMVMWQCFSYGEQMNVPMNAPNHDRLPRPSYATSEFYQIMLHCCQFQPTQRPTFAQLAKNFADIEVKQVRWKENGDHSRMPVSAEFLSVESCRLGPLTIVDRCLTTPTTTSMVTNVIQCVSIDGQIGLVDNDCVEPLHVVSMAKPTVNNTMHHLFQRRTVVKKTTTKTKFKQLSKEMIGAPQSDLTHTFHLGVSGETFGDVTNLNVVEQTLPSVPSKIEANATLLDEVMQAFTEIYPHEEDDASIDPVTHFRFAPVDINHSLSDEATDSNSRSSSSSKVSSDRFTRELEDRLRSGDLSEQGKHAYHSFLNRYASQSSSTPDEHSSISTDTDDNRSISSDQSRSLSTHRQASITGHPLPPPPELSSLGSKLTTATLAHAFKLPVPLTSTKHRTKKRFHLFT